MESMGTDSGKSLPDVDEDDGVGSAHTVNLTVKVDGKSNDQKEPTTPRSKHSAMEQRRRSKINERFEILKEMLPENDQKRDRASFLLEVIEYIKFLQGKAQKYEASPGWNQENVKLMTWRNQLPGDISTDNPHVHKSTENSPGYMYSGKIDDNRFSGTSTMLQDARNPLESELAVPCEGNEIPGLSSKESAPPVPMQTSLYASAERSSGFAPVELGRDKMTSQTLSPFLRSSCPVDSTMSSGMLDEHEELTIDEGTTSVSSAYSQVIFTTLTHALQNSGVDLSEANISVQINLGKRAIRRSETSTTVSNDNDHGHSTVGISGEEPEQVQKRHKPDDN